MRQNRRPSSSLLVWLSVAEEAQLSADADRFVRHDRQAVVAGRRRAGEDALADAVDDGFFQLFPAEAEKQQADAGPAVGRLRFGQIAFDPGFGVAADDGAGVAGGDPPRHVRPTRPSRR